MKGEYELPKHDSFGGASMCVKKSWGWVVNSFPCLGVHSVPGPHQPRQHI